LLVVRIEPGRSIVLRQQPPTSPWDGVWSFHVAAHGRRRCRLVSRSRTARGGLVWWLAAQAMDPIALVMTRRMLLGIKTRAESAVWTEPPVPVRAVS
jgi:hypothetical protein